MELDWRVMREERKAELVWDSLGQWRSGVEGTALDSGLLDFGGEGGGVAKNPQEQGLNMGGVILSAESRDLRK